MIQKKYLDLAGLTAYDAKLKEWIKSGTVNITDDEIIALFAIPYPANNEIWYTSIDGNIVTPDTDVLGAKITSNTYEDGKGVITCDGDVTSVEDYAFYNCSNLTSITIPNSTMRIGYQAFYNCSNLTSITIPNSVTNIGTRVFYNCYNLTSITIPNSVTRFGQGMFYDCSGLNSIIYEGTSTQWNAITKGTNWNYKVPATYVQCTDGQVTL